MLQKVTEREKVLTVDPKEIEVRTIMKARATDANAGLKDPAATFAKGKSAVDQKLADAKAANAPPDQIAAAEKAVAGYPKDEAAAKAQWNKDKGLAARAVS